MSRVVFRLVLLGCMGMVLSVICWDALVRGIVWGPGLQIAITDGADFLNYWAGPRIAHTDIDLLFDGTRYELALKQLYNGTFDMLRWSYPLHMLFFCAPFSALDYDLALLVWTLSGLGCYVAATACALPAGRRQYAALLLLAPVTAAVLFSRQNGFFVGAAALGVLVLLQHQRPILAGILLGCLTIKPQLFILWPLLLLMNREWRCIAAAAITSILLIATSLWAHGVDAWHQFSNVVPALQWRIINDPSVYEPLKLFHLMMPGPRVALGILGVPAPLAQGIQLAVSLAVLVGSICAFRHRTSLPLTALLLSSGSVLFSPYGFNYDMTLLTAALLLVWLSEPGRPARSVLPEVTVYLLPLLVFVVNASMAPIGPLLLALVFFGAVREALRQPLKRTPA